MRSALLCFLLISCGCDGDKRAADYLAAGSHQVGFRTLSYVDSSRPTAANNEYPGAADRTITVEVWYPAVAPDGPTRDAPLDVSGGPFPLIMHSHGFMDSRLGEGYLAQHLASHGYVVAAPDYPLSKGGAPGGSTISDVPRQPGDSSFALDRMIAENAIAGGPLAGAIDATRVAASGLSLGGLTTLLATFHPTLRDARLHAAFVMAPVSCFLTERFYQTAEVPLMVVHGDSDLLVPLEQNGQRAFERDAGPRELVVLRRGTHTGFAGYASLFDPMEHYDKIGCLAIQGKTDVASFSALGSEQQGISSDVGVCPMPCQSPADSVPLAAERQQDLVRQLALAFFEGELRGDESGRRFVAGPVAVEAPEITLRLPASAP